MNTTELKEKIEKLLTRDNFVAWLRTRPVDEEFAYHSNTTCAIARYLKDSGIPVGWSSVTVGGFAVTIDVDHREDVQIPAEIVIPTNAWLAEIDGTEGTMGSLLSFFEKGAL